MNPIAKQNLNRLINHNVLLGTMVIISCLQIYNYIRLNKVSCIFIFLVTFILSFQAVSKNITISLFLAIFVANFLLGCASFMEGHTVMVHTPFLHEHKDPIDTKMIPGFDKSGDAATSNGVTASVDGAVAASGAASVDGAADGAASLDGAASTDTSTDGAASGAASTDTSTDGAVDGAASTDASASGTNSIDSFRNIGGKLPGAADWPIMSNYSKY